MQIIDILSATEAEREWAARLMAGTEPWITLGRGLESCRASCNQTGRQLYIARAGPEPCGFILLERRGVAGSPYIASIAVRSEYRGKGVGRKLLNFAEDLFRSESKHIFLCVSSFNPRARALYERQGYSAIGELKDYIIEGASEILMHKRLRQS